MSAFEPPPPSVPDHRVRALTRRESELVAVFIDTTAPRQELMTSFIERYAERESRVIFEDEWLSVDESVKRYRRLRARQILQIAELLLVAAAVVGFGLLFFAVLLAVYW